MQGKKKFPLWGKILIVVTAVITAVTIGVLVYANYLYGKMKVEVPEDIIMQEETFDVDDNKDDLIETKAEEVEWNDTENLAKTQEVINILLAGEEAIHSDAGRGRTDSIMIATLNKKDKALRLTSIMRDTYVQIPGHSDNKINAAYGMGGMPLLTETIEKNFDISIDGYVLVGFDGFEQIIDYLGGVEITLSQKEAEYLNRTDYIDNYWNQNLYAGTINLNGDQALGYARVRYVNNGNLSGDFGRTKRHRDIMTAIFNKFKDKNLVELIAILPDLMELITTNLTRGQIAAYLTDFISINAREMETFRIPVDEACKITRINNMSVVLPDDLKTNITAMHQFIFGKVIVDKGKNDPNMMEK